MSFWEKITRDLQKGIKEGVEVVKGGAFLVKGKAEELTEEGKRQYQMITLKAKVHKEISNLGGRVYDLSEGKKNPLLDAKVKALVSRIRKMEDQILKLEEKPEPEKAAKKTAAKAKAKTTTTGKTTKKTVRTAAKRTPRRKKTAVEE